MATTSVEIRTVLQAGLDQLRLHVDHATDGLVAVIGRDNQQDVVPRVPLAGDRVQNHAGVAVGFPQHGEVFRRTEGHVVLDMVGFAAPQDAQRGPVAVDDLGDETLRHGAVAPPIQCYPQRVVHRPQSRPH